VAALTVASLACLFMSLTPQGAGAVELPADAQAAAPTTTRRSTTTRPTTTVPRATSTTAPRPSTTVGPVVVTTAPPILINPGSSPGVSVPTTRGTGPRITPTTGGPVVTASTVPSGGVGNANGTTTGTSSPTPTPTATTLPIGGGILGANSPLPTSGTGTTRTGGTGTTRTGTNVTGSTAASTATPGERTAADPPAQRLPRVTGIEYLPVQDTGGTDRASVSMRLPWDRTRSLRLQLYPNRSLSAWTLWVALVLLIMGFWLPRPGRLFRRANSGWRVRFSRSGERVSGQGTQQAE